MWQHPASGPPPRIGTSFSATPSGCLNLFSWRTGTNPFSSLIFSGHNERDTPMLGIVPKMEHVDDLSHPRYHSCVLPWTGVRKKTFNQFLNISPIDSSSVGGLKCLWLFQPYLGWWSPMTMFQMGGSTTNQLFIGEPPNCFIQWNMAGWQHPVRPGTQEALCRSSPGRPQLRSEWPIHDLKYPKHDLVCLLQNGVQWCSSIFQAIEI